MGLRSSKFNKTTDWLNNRLHHFIGKDFSKAEFKHQEKLLLADSRFQKAVQASRERLGLAVSIYSFSTDDIPNPGLLSVDDTRVHEEAIRVLEKTAMPNGWFEYICEYIINNGVVEDAEVEPQLHIEVDDVKNDELTVILKKGLTSKEYRTAWKALKVFLEKSPVYYDTTEENEQAKVYFAYQKGMTPSVIAKQYFPSEYTRDPLATRDRIKKIIKRYELKK
jgi:hypothetical protein